MSENPTVSVIMSIFNEPEEWLRESIDSILNQTFSDFEFIIINDNPSRRLNNQLLKEYSSKDNRIKVISNKANIGLTKSLNKGLDIAKGEFIARMDGDDISCLDRFEKQYHFMQNNPKYGVCGSYIKIFGDLSRKDSSLYTDCKKLKDSLLLKNPIPHPTAFIRKSILDQYGIKYNEEYLCAQDYKLWFDLSFVTLMTNLPYILLNYRVQKKQVSQIKSNSQQNFAAQVRRSAIEDFLGKTALKKFNKTNDQKLKFRFILKEYDRNNARSFLLLSVYLSYSKYKMIDHLLLLNYVSLDIILNNYRSVLLAVMEKKKTKI